MKCSNSSILILSIIHHSLPPYFDIRPLPHSNLSKYIVHVWHPHGIVPKWIIPINIVTLYPGLHRAVKTEDVVKFKVQQSETMNRVFIQYSLEVSSHSWSIHVLYVYCVLLCFRKESLLKHWLQSLTVKTWLYKGITTGQEYGLFGRYDFMCVCMCDFSCNCIYGQQIFALFEANYPERTRRILVVKG